MCITQDALAKIKRCVKQGGEAAAREAEYYIARELEQPAAAVKMRCLHLLEVLFQRSKLFRQAVAADCRGLFGCVLPEVSKSLNVKGTQAELGALRNLSLQLLAQWDASHGAHLPELHALCRFLSEVHRVQLDTAETDRTRAAELDRLLAARTSRVIKELEEQATAIEDNLNEIDAAFNVLFPRIVDEAPTEEAAGAMTNQGKISEDDNNNDNEVDDEDEDEYEDIAWESADEIDHAPASAGRTGFADSGGYSMQDTMAILGIHNMSFTLTISLGQAERLHGEESGGDDLLNHLKDCLRALRRHHIQRVAEWKVTLTRYSARSVEQQRDDAGVFDRTLREPVQRWLRWIEGITARINDVQQRCSDISHDRKQQQQQQQIRRKRPAELATEDNGESQKALRSETV